jgi:hypothetical protein
MCQVKVSAAIRTSIHLTHSAMGWYKRSEHDARQPWRPVALPRREECETSATRFVCADARAGTITVGSINGSHTACSATNIKGGGTIAIRNCYGSTYRFCNADPITPAVTNPHPNLSSP